MPRARRLLAVAFLILSCSGCGRREAHNQARGVQPPAEASSYEFLDTVLSSLARAHGGVVMVNSVSEDTSLVDLMTANQNGAIEISVAAEQLRPFSASHDENRRKAIEIMLGAYDIIRRSLAIQLAGYERIDSATTTQDISRFAGMQKMMSTGKVAYQQGSSLLASGAAIALMSTLAADHADTNQVVLDLTDRERSKLLARGDSLFGAALTDKQASGPASAAQILISGLTRRRSGR